jgi:Nucleotidyl transferase AbiEii toxin, Type IV TA system
MPDFHWHTVDTTLAAILQELMEEPLFVPFRLVGGTALSLQLGHRKSEDIDLFTDIGYDKIDFENLDQWFRQQYDCVSDPTPGPVGFGRSYLIGSNAERAIKVDIYHTDPFIQPALEADGIRMATLEAIAATGRREKYNEFTQLINLLWKKRVRGGCHWPFG